MDGTTSLSYFISPYFLSVRWAPIAPRSKFIWNTKPARRKRFLKDCAYRGVHSAEEDVEVGGALHLHQREEGVRLHARILLLRMTWNKMHIILLTFPPFYEILTDRPTDRPTDQPTDRRPWGVMGKFQKTMITESLNHCPVYRIHYREGLAWWSCCTPS